LRRCSRWGESSRGSTAATRELIQVAAMVAAPFLCLSEHGEEKRKGIEEEVGWRCRGAS
jgi:hypothetical protein